jgi:hypothetical protein
MPRSKVELFAATRQGSPFLPLTPIDADTSRDGGGVQGRALIKRVVYA